MARIAGSHHIYIKEGTNYRISVPGHGNKDLKTGLVRAVMKIAGITDDEL